jgi:hypothetical protein
MLLCYGDRVTNASAPGSGRPIVASGVTTSVIIVVTDGKALDDCLDSALGGRPDDRSTEVVLVDLREDRTAQGELLGVAAQAGPAVRVLTLPGATVVDGHDAGLAAARGRHCLLYEESARLSAALADELLGGRDAAAGLAARLDLVRDLQQGVVQRPDVADFGEHAVRDQAEQIRTLLVAEPDRHADVVTGVRERRIADFPWSTVNRGRARDLAILYSFVPFIDTSGLVAARRLREWGVVTDVISQDMSNSARVDEASMRIVAEALDEARILSGKRRVNHWPSVRGFVESALAEVGELEAAKGAYRSVYSRAMVPSSHFAAAVLKLRSPELRWVAEFSDPILQNPYGETRVGDIEDDWLRAELADGFRRAGHAVPEIDRLFGWAELIAYAFADDIIFTNEHQREFMLGYCSDHALAERARGISRVMHHPQPGSDLYAMARPVYRLPEGVVHIGYFGNFYPNRGLTEITGALDNLTLAERDRLQLHVFTSRPDALLEEVLEQGLADVIRVSPMFGYLEYLNLTTRFDVLLINDYATSPHYVPNPYLPAKLADYRGSGSRIWSLYEPGSVLAAADVAYASRLGDVAAATEVLRQLLQDGPSQNRKER